MAKAHKVDLKRLEKKVTSISNALAKLSSADDFRKLILEWRRPGYTTPAEWLFLAGLVDSLESQVAAVGKLKGALIKGSNAVEVG